MRRVPGHAHAAARPRGGLRAATTRGDEQGARRERWQLPSTSTALFATAAPGACVCVQGCGCAWRRMHVCGPILHRCSAMLTSPRIHYARWPQDPLCTPCLEHGEVSLSCADRDRVVSLQWSEKFWLLVDHLQIFAALWVAECAAASKRFPQSWCTGSQMLVYILVYVYVCKLIVQYIQGRASVCRHMQGVCVYVCICLSYRCTGTWTSAPCAPTVTRR